MNKNELIAMLNGNLADEHAAVLRYLSHAYLEGEDTVIGANLLARSREEMWHLHWLGMAVCSLGGEPVLTPGPYPFDPKSQRTLLKSYIAYEEKLIPLYNDEAANVADPHIKRVLLRQAWESAIHARRFQKLLDKLDPATADRPSGGQRQLPAEFISALEDHLTSKYSEMWQHIRMSWTFQKEGSLGWQLMDQAMEKMKQLSLFTEAIAEDGMTPRFTLLPVDQSKKSDLALTQAIKDTASARDKHALLMKDKEFLQHGGLVMKLDLTIKQEDYQLAEMKDWLKKP